MRHSALKKYRIDNGLSMERMGELVGVQKATVWKWERGVATPRPAHLAKIRDLTHGAVTPNDFIPEPHEHEAAE
jgi:transcriptional regulator with XRE-family HTH domain